MRQFTESTVRLGEGYFGFAFIDEIIDRNGRKVTVACKGLKDNRRTLGEMEIFIKEIKLMLYITYNLGGHENVVRCIGLDIHKFLQSMQVFKSL
jgi:hypothetical protein